MKKKQTTGKENKTQVSKNETPANPRMGALAAAAISFLAYLPVLSNGFVNWDDDATIVNNPNLARLGGESLRNIFDIQQGSAGLGNYNPLTIFSFYVEKMMAGALNPTMIHFDNVLLHALTVYFVVRVLQALGIGLGGALVGGLLFGLHPMRVESVAWATERKDVLFAVFFFAALLNYIRWYQSNETGKTVQRYYILAIVLALLSCLAKVQAVTLPLSMLAIDYWFKRPFSVKSVLVEKAPFWILAFIFGAINVYTLGLQGAAGDTVTNFTAIDRLCIGAWSFCVYLYKLLIPFPMLALYAYPKQLPVWIYAAPLLFAGITFVVWRLHRSDRRIWVFGFLFFLFNVMFLLQILAAGQGFLADRFTYVPYFGFFAICAYYYDRASQDATLKNKWNTGLIALGLIYAIMTYMQIGVWKNSATLWSHVIDYEGNKSGLPHWYRGQYYRSQGQFETAMTDYTNALALEPQNPELINSRGKTYFDMAMSGKYPKEKAAEFLKSALDDYNASLNLAGNLKPQVKGAMLINRGAALGTINQLDKAMQDFNEGLQLDPGNKTGYMNRGFLYEKLHQSEPAIADFTKYLTFDPANTRIMQEREKLRRSQQQNAQ
ncbi:MAG: tetratricopeptide repeat protein [Bacteroidota bacterium]